MELPAHLPKGVGKLSAILYMLGFKIPQPGPSAQSKSLWTVTAMPVGKAARPTGVRLKKPLVGLFFERVLISREEI